MLCLNLGAIGCDPNGMNDKPDGIFSMNIFCILGKHEWRACCCHKCGKTRRGHELSSYYRLCKTCGARDYDSCIDDMNMMRNVCRLPLIKLRRNASDYEKYYACIDTERQISELNQASDKSKAITLYKLLLLRLPELSPKDSTAMVDIPAGEFEMGDEDTKSNPKRRVYLDAYSIGVFCVTVRQYAIFLLETGYKCEDFMWFSLGSNVVADLNSVKKLLAATNDELDKYWRGIDRVMESPVTSVSWEDAVAYATWAGGMLPTEAQWEKAARGPNEFIFPWGNEWDPKKCHNNSDNRCRVADYLAGMSGYGTFNQSGNVTEWCADLTSGLERVTKGHPWIEFLGDFFYKASWRGSEESAYKSQYVGFRIVKNKK